MLGTKLCNNCWEVVNRLPKFMESDQGRDFIRGLLVLTGREEAKRV